MVSITTAHIIPCQINHYWKSSQVTISDFCNFGFWYIGRPIVDKMKCKISAYNMHPFQDTAVFMCWLID